MLHLQCIIGKLRAFSGRGVIPYRRYMGLTHEPASGLVFQVSADLVRGQSRR